MGGCSSLSGLDPGSSSCTGDDSSTGWKVIAGYDINRNLAVEGGYVDLGTFHGSASGTVFGTPGMATGNARASGFSLDAVGTLLAGDRFGLVGRIGVFEWSLDATASRTSVAAYSNGTFSGSARGASLDFGVGVKYDFDKNLGVRAELQKFANIGSDATGKSDVSLISASLVYRFRSSFYQ